MWLTDVFQCTKNLMYDFEKRAALIKELENHRFKIQTHSWDSFTCFNWKFKKLASDDQLALIRNNGYIDRKDSDFSDSFKIPRLNVTVREESSRSQSPPLTCPKSPDYEWGSSFPSSPRGEWDRMPDGFNC